MNKRVRVFLMGLLTASVLLPLVASAQKTENGADLVRACKLELGGAATAKFMRGSESRQRSEVWDDLVKGVDRVGTFSRKEVEMLSREAVPQLYTDDESATNVRRARECVAKRRLAQLDEAASQQSTSQGDSQLSISPARQANNAADIMNACRAEMDASMRGLAAAENKSSIEEFRALHVEFIGRVASFSKDSAQYLFKEAAHSADGIMAHQRFLECAAKRRLAQLSGAPDSGNPPRVNPNERVHNPALVATKCLQVTFKAGENPNNPGETFIKNAYCGKTVYVFTCTGRECDQPTYGRGWDAKPGTTERVYGRVDHYAACLRPWRRFLPGSKGTKIQCFDSPAS